MVKGATQELLNRLQTPANLQPKLSCLMPIPRVGILLPNYKDHRPRGFNCTSKTASPRLLTFTSVHSPSAPTNQLQPQLQLFPWNAHPGPASQRTLPNSTTGETSCFSQP